MATQRYNLSVVRIDLNALDLQRREADCVFLTEGNYILQHTPVYNCGTTHNYWACPKFWNNMMDLAMFTLLSINKTINNYSPKLKWTWRIFPEMESRVIFTKIHEPEANRPFRKIVLPVHPFSANEGARISIITWVIILIIAKSEKEIL